MNKSTIIGILSGAIIGATGGVIGTYFYMKNRCDKTIDEEVRKFKDDYVKRDRKPYFEELSSGEIMDKGDIESDGRPLMEAKSSLSNKPVDIKKTDYHKVVSKNYMKSDVTDILSESESPDDDDPEVSVVEKIGSDDIVMVTAEEFTENDSYEEVSLLWYVESDILQDEYEEEVMDRAPLLGSVLEDVREEILSHEDDSNRPLALYVRNDKMNCYYEVEIIFGEIQ